MDRVGGEPLSKKASRKDLGEVEGGGGSAFALRHKRRVEPRAKALGSRKGVL